MGGRRYRGFTLLELMMAIAVIGVILAIAIPSFTAFRLNNRMTSAANDLLAGINAARSEAIKQQRSVSICPSATPSADPPSCSAALSSDSSMGWFVWIDTDGDSVLDATENVLLRHATLDPALALTSNWQVITYQASGFPAFSGPLAADAPAAVVMCDERLDEAVSASYRKRVLTVSRTGRPTVLRGVPEIDALGDTVAPTCI